MDLEPCSRADFDSALLGYLYRPGWRYRITTGQRCEGYVDGRLVLRMERRGKYAVHFRAPVESAPRVLPEGFRYK